ncbi:MAG TPA: hypothetical protein VFW98_02135 [Gemmatimonadaceae bacterium]|nr:hypothetical protein [Gemmatimonadaceae bacterium]
MITLRRLPAACVLLLAIAACHDDSPTQPPALNCSPSTLISLRRIGVNAATTNNTLAPLQGATASAADLAACLDLINDGSSYLVVPQFPADTVPFTPTGFSIGSQPAAGGNVAGRLVSGAPDRGPGLGVRELPRVAFDNMLRRADHRMAMRAPASRISPNAERTRSPRPLAVTVPAEGSIRSFHVLSNLDGTQFKTAAARLEYVGQNILMYVDTASPPGGFSSAQLHAFGDLFDKVLYGIDVNAFGPPSDIDGNGHIDVLLSPIVNAITPRPICDSGFVAGFFFGLDLLPHIPQPDTINSNGAEVFYAMVPDSGGTVSCSHGEGAVESITPATFVHEFQHMISFNQHVLVRNGPDEVAWLNEGLSHIAEWLGAKYYMNKYPPPTGRTSPDQLYPDSAEGFVSGDIFNSYTYLLNTASQEDSAAVLNWPGDGTLAERGAAWLFLRWLGDQKGTGIYKKLDQTMLTGVANVEAQSGETFPTLFGDFSLALYTDSLPGVPRDHVAQRYQFPGEIPLREIYARIFLTSNGPTPQIPRPFPLQVTAIQPATSTSSRMFPGTMSFFSVQTGQDGSALDLSFTAPDGTPLAASLHPQVTIFRCPSADACPLVVNP